MARVFSWVFGGFIFLALSGTAFAEPSVARPRFIPPPAKDGHSYPDCYCTDSEGRRVEMGERACLTVGGRDRMALCGMSLNNPAWRMQEDGCPLT